MTHAELEQAYRAYGHLIARRCRRLLRDEIAAEDATQDTFVRLWRYGESFTVAQSKLGWLYRVADRCCFDLMSRKSARAETELPPDDVHGADTAPATHVIEDREVILRFLGRFDERLRQVAVMYYLDELSQEEIAMHTGWSRQTVIKKLAFLRERAQVLRATFFGTGGVR